MVSLGSRLVAAALLFAAPALAQPTFTACDALLDAAEQAYTERVFEDAESLALDCTYTSGASLPELTRAHRLLALTYIKAERIGDARLMIVKLVAGDPEYVADPTVELPTYVALVDAVRRQLQVTDAERAAASAQPVVAAEDRVDVNTADAEALDTVPGIGPALAGRIIAYRESYGPFRRIEDLQDVRGIGARSLERMAPYVTTGGGEVRIVPRVRPAAADPATAPDRAPSPRINVNTASASELEALPRIGPALAQRIIDFRTEYGPFRSVDELELVRGIGPRTVEGFASLVTVE